MNSFFKINIISLIFLMSCSPKVEEGIKANLLISPEFQFSYQFFECELKQDYNLLYLESFLSKLIKDNSMVKENEFDINIFFPKSNYVNKFIINLQNYSDKDIYTEFISMLSKMGFDEIASCVFDKNNLNGIQLLDFDNNVDKSSYTAEILRCSYNKEYNYGTFRVAIDRFVNKINSIGIPYKAIYLEDDLSKSSFLWINNFYVKDYSKEISEKWINDSDSKEIKDEFIENARCIDAKIYDAFLIT